ncbi:MAG: hypothetical protein GPJ21_22735, partial [Microcystis aeruginosa W13-11]|nr:hypothetical protein [Microcystis aeruginosa W13-11]
IYQSSRTFRGAERKLEKWIRIGGILYQSSASMIQKHLPGICNYFGFFGTCYAITNIGLEA